MRRPRLKADPASSKAYYHCVSRVVDRTVHFDAEAMDLFVTSLRQYERFSGVRVITFCVLSDHFHLLVEESAPSEMLSDEELIERVAALDRPKLLEEARLRLSPQEAGRAPAALYRAQLLLRMFDVSTFLKAVKQRFTQGFHSRERLAGRRRRGTLWEARFKSVIVQESAEALATMAAYIDLNPVRRGLVAHPAEYRWCGFGAASAGEPAARAGLTVVENLLAAAAGGGCGPESAEEFPLYREWLSWEAPAPAGAEAEGAAGPKVLSRAEMLRRRVRYFTDGVALGDKEWIERLFALRRAWFGPRRKSGGRRLRGLDAPGLCTMRDLQVDVIGGPSPVGGGGEPPQRASE